MDQKLSEVYQQDILLDVSGQLFDRWTVNEDHNNRYSFRGIWPVAVRYLLGGDRYNLDIDVSLHRETFLDNKR